MNIVKGTRGVGAYIQYKARNLEIYRAAHHQYLTDSTAATSLTLH